MKKIICLVLAVVTVVIFAGCGDKEPPVTSTPEPAASATPDSVFDESSENVWDENTVFAVMVEIADETFIASVDDKEYEFYFSERSLKDVKGLEIEVGDEVSIDYEVMEDGSLSAVTMGLMSF